MLEQLSKQNYFRKSFLDYEIYNIQKKLINTAQVVLVFVDMKTKTMLSSEYSIR